MMNSPLATVRLPHRLALVFRLTLLAIAIMTTGRAWAATGPLLLTETASTRGIAIESVTFRRDPFPLTASVPFSADQRTRVVLFAMNLDLLAGEGANSLSADAEDASHRHYGMRVEAVNPVPGFEWMSAVTVRLSDDMGDIGDVLVRITLHGMTSNRVRIAIGHSGGGPSDDSGSVPTPAPPVQPSPTPWPTPNSYTSPSTAGDAARFLEQATFGPTTSDVALVQSVGFRAYLDAQFNAPASSYPVLAPYPTNDQTGCPADPANAAARTICLRDNYTMFPLQVQFFQNALAGQDQLRQRVAFALSQIFVTSGLKIRQASSMSSYLQMLSRDAFGNFRQLLYDVTLSPTMGHYLDMVNNDKANPATGVAPNENYAREVMQLFSIGVVMLNPDGTVQLDAQGQPIPSYDQDTIEGFAHLFTGWTYPTMPGATMQRHNPEYYIGNMVLFPANHETGTKQLLNGVTLPAGQTGEQDLNAGIDNIFNHPNVGPFISKQLIQHLVTSNPSPGYVQRIAAVFNNNGAGVRGDLKAVVAAILLDPEARGDVKTAPDYGHLREPALLILNLLRSLNASSDGTRLSDYTNGMGQNLFYSASVFNYFPPDYEVPGTGILGPEFGIQSSAAAVSRANFVNTLVYSRIAPAANTSGNGTAVDLSSLVALGGDTNKLLDTLNTLMLHGSMSPVTRAVITAALTSVPATDSKVALKRAQAAVYLVATSSQFQVER